MEHLYAPWRSAYFDEESTTECIFCHLSQSKADKKHYIFYRDDVAFAVMNKFPYTPGHFMIIPHLHVDSPTLLPEESWLHLNRLTLAGIALLEEFGAHGVNFGINIRQSAGAGIPKHLHLHLVPRYNSDTNFITTIASSRVYGVDFKEVYQKINLLAQKHFKSL